MGTVAEVRATVVEVAEVQLLKTGTPTGTIKGDTSWLMTVLPPPPGLGNPDI
jgi:hypothetical protein